MRPRVWSVAELIRELNHLLEQGFSGIRVEGELTNVNASARGHLYFTLKDGDAALDCVMWSSRAGRLRFTAEDGLAVLASGSLTVYPQRGRLQMVVDALEPQGQGALQLAFEQLKRRLAAEGLFEAERKRPMPALPLRVGIVTSLSGAAIRDMLKVLGRRPRLEVLVADARVQGDGAAGEIAAALERLAASGRVDVIIVGRGGGSLEDLWAFNEEPVARAIAACPVPVISGVGHEVDFTIADFVADLRAATPTQAAEMVVLHLERQERRLAEALSRLVRDMRRHQQLARAQLQGLAGSSGLARVPQRLRLLRQRLAQADRLPLLLRKLVESSRRRLLAAETTLRRVPGQIAAAGHGRLLSSRTQQLTQLMLGRLQRLRATVAAHQRALAHLGPQAVLKRGYSITTVEGRSRPLKDAGDTRAGQVLVTTLARGSVRSVVHSGGSKPHRPPPPAATQQSLFDEPRDGHSDGSEDERRSDE